MSTCLDLTPRAASLVEVEPDLGRYIGAREAATLGRRRLLPVLSVPAGRWSPPVPESLGSHTLALVVLSGLLVHDRALLGPGDRFEPWTVATDWTAGTDVRVSVLGDEFSAALAEWPDAATRILERPRPGHRLVVDGALEARVEELLWRLGREWGRLEGDGVALPPGTDACALARLTASDPQAVAAVLQLLTARGALRPGPAGRWLLPAPDRRSELERGPALRARVTEQFAVARAARDEYVAVSSALAHHRQRSFT